MTSGGSVRSGVWIGMAIMLGGAFSVPVRADETDCSRWMRESKDARDQAEASRKSGDLAAAVAQLQKAHDALSHAMKACPDSAQSDWCQVESRLAYCRSKEGRFSDACEVYKGLLETEPNRFVDRALYADALEQAGRYEEAVLQLKTLAQLTPERKGALYCNMAMIYALELGDGPRAVEAAKKGLELADAPQSCLDFAWGKGLAVWGVRMLETGETDRGLHVLQDARAKLAALLEDPDYGSRARAEVAAIDTRIHQGHSGKKAREKR